MGWIDEFFSSGGVGDLIQGGASLYGYQKLIGDLNETEARIGGYNPATGAYEGGLGKVYGDVGTTGTFKPYSMTSGIGTSVMDVNGNMTSNLGGGQQAYSDQMRTGAQNMYNQATGANPFAARGNMMYNRSLNNAFAGQAQNYFNRAAQDPAAREQDIYERARAMQRPEEDRQYSSMNANLFGGGRGGMASGEFGGSPEQMAFGKAQAEARNTASFNAMGQAQQEMQNYQNMGSNLYGMGQQNQQMYGQMGQAWQQQGLAQQGLQGQLAGQMGQAQYDPYNQLAQQNQQGLAGGQMMNQSGQALAGMLAQLGIGGMTTDVNLSNVRGDAFTGLMESIGAAASGGGLDSILASILNK